MERLIERSIGRSIERFDRTFKRKSLHAESATATDAYGCLQGTPSARWSLSFADFVTAMSQGEFEGNSILVHNLFIET